VFFLQNKSETQEVLKKFLKRAQNEFDAMFFKRGPSLLNLLLKYMKDFFLDMTQTHAHIVFLIRTLVVLKPHVTWYLMRLMAPKWSNMILIL
jgi:hypothetical protein